MPFVHPLIFWTGLGAVSVPIIIHLLNRRRFRLRPWAAMRFLLESLRKNRRRLQLEEMILLLLRCLVVLMLALAVSRFKGCRAMESMPGGQRAPRTIVFVLDDSYSMGQRHGAGTLFSQAASALVRQIQSLKQADKAYVLPASRVGHEDAVLTGEGLARRVEKLKVSDLRFRPAECLSAARGILEEAQDDKFLFVLSDWRRVDLGSRGDSGAIQQQFKDLEKLGAKVVVMDFGRPVVSNLTMEGIAPVAEVAEAKIAIAGQPVRLALTVRNNGPHTAKNVEVRVSGRFRAGGEFREVTWPGAVIESIEPGRTRQIEHKITCPEPGAAVLTAQLPPDDLEGDNVAHLALDVRKEVKILVVDGQLDVTNPAQSESYFLVRALDPNKDASYGNHVEVIGPEAIADVNFRDFDLVALVDVPEFSASVKSLQDYVRGGGGLAIFTGDRINLDFFNGALYDGGAGLSPFRVLARKGIPMKERTPSMRQEFLAGPESFFRLAPKSVRTDSMLRSFEGEADTMSGLIRFFAFTPANTHTQPVRSSSDAGPPIVLASLNDPNESPAVVARPYGQGTVLLFYTTASTRWNDWPIDPVGSYVVVMNDMRNYLTRPRDEGLAGRVGEPIVFEMLEKLPANASDVQRRRQWVQSAMLRPPQEPNTIRLEPKTRFENLAAQIQQATDLMRKAGLKEADRIDAALKDADGLLRRGQFMVSAEDRARRKADRDADRRTKGRAENRYVEEALEEIATTLEDLRQSDRAKENLAVLNAAERARSVVTTALRGSPALLAMRELRYARAFSSGVYNLALLDASEKPIDEVLYARNPDPAEGELQNSSQQEIAAALGSQKFRYEKARPPDEEGAVAGIDLEASKEYWTWAIVAMLVMLALETVLGQRFGHYTVPDSSGR